MRSAHVFRFDSAGARDVLRQHGLSGHVLDPGWQRAEAMALLDDAWALLASYGLEATVRESCDTLIDGNRIGRVWAVPIANPRLAELCFAVDATGEISWWMTRFDHAGYAQADPPPASVRSVTFDHVTREVLGEFVYRADGKPLVEVSGGVAMACRRAPLESLMLGITGLLRANSKRTDGWGGGRS